MERFDDLCSQSKYPKNEVNMIYRSIFDLSQQIPNYVCQVVKERLFQMNSNLLQALRGYFLIFLYLFKKPINNFSFLNSR